MENKEELFNLISSQHAEETKSLFYRYLSKWHWFLSASVVGVLLGFLIYIKLPNTYQISSRILVNSEEKDLNSILSFNKSPNDFGGNQTNLENQIGILRSYTLYRNALNNLNWKYSWFEKKLLYNYDLYKNNPFELSLSEDFVNAKNIPIQIEIIDGGNYHLKIKGETYKDGIKKKINVSQGVKFGSQFSNEFFKFTIKQLNGEIGKKYILIFNDLDYLTKSYLSLTEIIAENEKSDFITIFIEGRNREREADFINELNSVFIEFGIKSKFENSENSVKFIDQQLERLKNSLGTAEENYSNYRRNNQVMDLGQEAQTVYSRLEEIEQDKYLTQMQLDYYDGLQQSLDNADKIENMVNPSILGISDASLTNMITKLIELYSRKEALSVSVQDKNPALVVIDNQIKVTREGLDQAIRNQKESTQLKIRRLEEQYGTIQQRLRKLPDTERKLIGVQREFDLNNDYYNYMLQKKAEMSISKSSIVPKVQIIDNAIVEAAKQTGPNLIMTLAFGLVGGNTIPFILITLISFFNNKIESIVDVERRSTIRVLEGIIKHKYKANLPVIQYPRSGIAESFRGLKSNINILTDRSVSKVISINSLIPEEGKSFISSNLSAVIAKTNKKVLLIGTDMHKPTLHKFLGIKEAAGLSNYLNGETNIEDIIFETSIANLYCIQAGLIVENPSDIIDKFKFEKLLEQTKKMFDFIIIDNAPLLLIPDAIFTSQYSDLSLFVIRVNYSHKEEIKQINKIVEFNKIENAAIVMNDIPQNGYGYGYGKKYWKKGYGEYRKEKRLFSV